MVVLVLRKVRGLRLGGVIAEDNGYRVTILVVAVVPSLTGGVSDIRDVAVKGLVELDGSGEC